mmetsp:Transcript_44550/g.96867  ORF Transcript_44550/g.96867 Transcript_44550/m.96867 type:complete len:351 (-) Transcript_44550:47-1099(-)
MPGLRDRLGRKALVTAAGCCATYASFKVLQALRALAYEGHVGQQLRENRADPLDAAHRHILGCYIKNKDGLYIYWKRWDPAGESKGVVLIVHGMGEYIGRYEHVAKALNAAGMTVFALDHQGHGRSEGDRCYAKRLADFVDDILQFAREVVKPAMPEEKKPFILGHSMGGLLCVMAALKSPHFWHGVVLSAPALMVDPSIATPLNCWLAKQLSQWLPKLQVDKLGGERGVRNRAGSRQYQLDPLIYNEGLKARMGSEMLDSMDLVAELRGSFALPFLIQQGTNDPIVQPKGAGRFHAAASSHDKTLIMYDNFSHELYNECEADCSVELDPTGVVTNKPVRDAIAWILERA